MIRLKAAVLILMTAIMFFSCTKPFVGKNVDIREPGLCRIDEFPKSCREEYSSLNIDFTIDKAGENGDYLVTGYFDPTQGQLKSFNNVVMNETSFRMLVISDNVVVDNIPFLIRGQDLGHHLTFKFKFHSDVPVDALKFYGKISVRG